MKYRTYLTTLLYSFLLGLILPASAQNSLQHQKDSLRHALEHTEGIDKLQTYNKLYYIYMAEAGDDQKMDTLMTLFEQAEAEAIRAKALAEAEGIDKKAEAMKKYGEAAVIEMIMNALPEIAKNVAEPLSKVDKITMYGEGNSAKLLSDIVNGTTQVTEGISAGMGLDLKSLLAGALGGKLAAGNSQPVQVTVAPQAQPDAAAASADTPEQQV